jgi:predicted nuclease of predicted toxin-antitoxin system
LRFLADMGVDVRVVDWLRRQGHDAVHLRERGMHRAPDPEIFHAALAEDRIVLTFDLDFGDLAAFARDDRARVVVFRLANARAASVIDRLATVLTDSADVFAHGVIVIIEDRRHRVRYLPIGTEPGSAPST